MIRIWLLWNRLTELIIHLIHPLKHPLLPFIHFSFRQKQQQHQKKDQGHCAKVGGFMEQQFIYSAKHNWSFCCSPPPPSVLLKFDVIEELFYALSILAHFIRFIAHSSSTQWMNASKWMDGLFPAQLLPFILVCVYGLHSIACSDSVADDHRVDQSRNVLCASSSFILRLFCF